VLAAALLVLLVAGPFVQSLTAQPAPRIATTGALVDEGTFRIDDYLLGTDKAAHDGHVYSDKAPAQPLLAVPAYAAARLVGAEPARVERVHDNLTLWWLSFVSGVVPLLGIVVLAGRALARRGLPVRASVLAVAALGTFLMPFASNLYGHVLAGALTFAAWSALDGEGGRWRPWAAGALLGLAVTSEYQTVLAVAVLLGWLLVARRLADLVRVVAAAAPFGIALLGYHTLVFGGPFESGYSAKAVEGTNAVTTHLSVPTPAQALQVLASDRGLLVMMPLLVLAIAGLGRRWWQDRDPAGGVGLAMLGAYTLMHAAWADSGGGVWAGEMPGPRFVTAAVPFVIVGLADAWERTTPLVRRAVAAVSVSNMLLVTAVYHLIPNGATVWESQLDRLRDGLVAPSVFAIALGPLGWVVHGLLVAAAVAWVVLADRSLPAPEPVDEAREPSLTLLRRRPMGGTWP
jgi:hypothetical protein